LKSSVAITTSEVILLKKLENSHIETTMPKRNNNLSAEVFGRLISINMDTNSDRAPPTRY
jgi:hypothetical protein